MSICEKKKAKQKTKHMIVIIVIFLIKSLSYGFELCF